MSQIETEIKPQLFHEFLDEKINKSKVSQAEIAKSLGFDQPNIIRDTADIKIPS